MPYFTLYLLFGDLLPSLLQRSFLFSGFVDDALSSNQQFAFHHLKKKANIFKIGPAKLDETHSNCPGQTKEQFNVRLEMLSCQVSV